MFDIGFWELLLIFVVALVVLGPERLPQVAARAGRWTANARAIVRNLRAQIEEELAQKDRAPAEPAPADPEEPPRNSDEEKA